MNNSVFGKTMENGSMEILSQLVSEPNNRTIKYFSEDLLATKVKKTKVKTIKIIYNCYMDTESFIIHIKTEDAYEDMEDDVQQESDTSNYEVHRPLLASKNKKVSGLIKGKLVLSSV